MNDFTQLQAELAQRAARAEDSNLVGDQLFGLSLSTGTYPRSPSRVTDVAIRSGSPVSGRRSPDHERARRTPPQNMTHLTLPTQT